MSPLHYSVWCRITLERSDESNPQSRDTDRPGPSFQVGGEEERYGVIRGDERGWEGVVGQKGRVRDEDLELVVEVEVRNTKGNLKRIKRTGNVGLS